MSALTRESSLSVGEGQTFTKWKSTTDTGIIENLIGNIYYENTTGGVVTENTQLAGYYVQGNR